MHKILSCGLIGFGGFGQMHYYAIQRQCAAGRLRLAAVADPFLDDTSEKALELKRSGTAVYQDHRTMLDREKLDVVMIAAPIALHHEIAKDCLARRVFIYLEKPAVPLYSQLEELLSLDKENRIAVGFQHIESDWGRTIKEWIVQGRLGEDLDIRTMACWPRPTRYYERAGWAGRMHHNGRAVFDGPATNALAHQVHQMMYFASPEAHGFDRPVEVQGEFYRARPIEGYDVVCMRGLLQTGARFFATFSHAASEARPYQLEVHGTRGWARVSDDGKLLESSWGTVSCMQSDTELMDRSYASFLDYAEGRTTRPPTRLRDTIGYSLATMTSLRSSAGIHTIEPAHINVRGAGADSIYTVAGFHEDIRACYENGELFSERSLPWAVKTMPVRSDEIETTVLSMSGMPA